MALLTEEFYTYDWAVYAGHLTSHSSPQLRRETISWIKPEFVLGCLTDLSNIEYTCGKAEDVLPDIMNDLKDCEDIVGIVDPPRPGMRKSFYQG